MKKTDMTQEFGKLAAGDRLTLRVERQPIYATSEKDARYRENSKQVIVYAVHEDYVSVHSVTKTKDGCPSFYRLSLVTGEFVGRKARYHTLKVLKIKKGTP